MTVSERQLEENEVKLDNILHKIIQASKQIQDLNASINWGKPRQYNQQIIDEIDTLAKIINNLATLADDIDIADESITATLEQELKEELDGAISRIVAVRELLKH